MTGGTSAVPPPAVASLAARVAARLLDTLVALAAGAVLAVPGAWIVAARGHWVAGADGGYVLESAPAIGLVLIAGGVLASVVVSAWNTGVRQGRTGQSLGKRRLGLLTVDARGARPLGAPRGLLRWLAGALLAMPCLLTYLWAFVDPRRRTWHDLLAGSLVVAA